MNPLEDLQQTLTWVGFRITLTNKRFLHKSPCCVRLGRLFDSVNLRANRGSLFTFNSNTELS